MSYDPLPALEKLTCPVLALYGELDTIVAARANGDRMERALAKAGNQDVTVTVLPRANHHFFAASSGGPGEIARLRGFAPGYLEVGLNWLRAHVDEPGLPVPPVIAMAEGIDLNARSSGPSDESRHR
jgi:pimeloyl-ACP methyl ester carboxylesterase